MKRSVPPAIGSRRSGCVDRIWNTTAYSVLLSSHWSLTRNQLLVIQIRLYDVVFRFPVVFGSRTGRTVQSVGDIPPCRFARDLVISDIERNLECLSRLFSLVPCLGVGGDLYYTGIPTNHQLRDIGYSRDRQLGSATVFGRVEWGVGLRTKRSGEQTPGEDRWVDWAHVWRPWGPQAWQQDCCLPRATRRALSRMASSGTGARRLGPGSRVQGVVTVSSPRPTRLDVGISSETPRDDRIIGISKRLQIFGHRSYPWLIEPPR